MTNRPAGWWTAWLFLLAVALELGRAKAAPGATPEELFRAIRQGDHQSLRAALAGGVNIDVRDDRGDTPLMAVALYADVAALEILLAQKPDLNATNRAGATALLRAATDPGKTELLLQHGANPNPRSDLGNTALHIAARRPGNARAVRLLLDRGAEVNVTNTYGATPLMAAGAADDFETIQLLLERGADVNAKPNMDGGGFIWGGGRTPLMWAAFRGNQRVLKLLLQRGAKVNEFTLVGGALGQAAWGEQIGAARLLLEAGAQVDQRDSIANYTPLHWAASSEHSDPALVKLLLARGANANSEGGQSVDGFLGVAQTPLLLARKRGETPMVRALLAAGAHETPAGTRKQAARARGMSASGNEAAIADAVQSAVGPLQQTAMQARESFLKHATRQDCVSCHQQQLPMAAIGLARARGVWVDTEAARKQVELVKSDIASDEERDLQPTFHPEPAIGDGYQLFGLRSEGQPAFSGSDAYVHHLASIQSADGCWHYNLPRPPIQSSDIGATALAVHALRFFALPGRQREFEQRIQHARRWLRKVRPETNEELVYQLLGLAWAGERAGQLKSEAAELLRQQRADGSWAQLPGLAGDAFATGQSLYALLEAAAFPATHPALQRAQRFLLETQLADGTWHVTRRAFPFQPPMKSGFPHGADSWLSAAATSWAVLGLAHSLDPAQTPARLAAAPAPRPSLNLAAGSGSPQAEGGPAKKKPVPPTVDFARDVKPILERSCISCHGGERPKGGFRVESRPALLKGGNRGQSAVVPHQPAVSELLLLVADQVEDLEMPPLGKRDRYPSLTAAEVKTLRDWIEQGAGWPDGTVLRASKN